MWGFGRGPTIFQSHSLYYLILSYPILPFVYTYVWLSHLVLRSPLHRSSTAYILQSVMLAQQSI
jgi:hypothetical protein